MVGGCSGINNNQARTTIPFSAQLYRTRFIERPNKFLLRCSLDDPTKPQLKDQVVEAHLPDPGRLEELLLPGGYIWLRRAWGQTRKTQWLAVLVQVPDRNEFVLLDTTLANRLVAKALAEEALPELAGWSLQKAEFTHGDSR